MPTGIASRYTAAERAAAWTVIYGDQTPLPRTAVGRRYAAQARRADVVFHSDQLVRITPLTRVAPAFVMAKTRDGTAYTIPYAKWINVGTEAEIQALYDARFTADLIADGVPAEEHDRRRGDDDMCGWRTFHAWLCGWRTFHAWLDAFAAVAPV